MPAPSLLTKTPSALAIPEVVVLILSSLPRRSLQETASLVCRQWYLLGRPLLHPRDFYWLGRIPLTKRYLLEGLRSIQTLPIISSTTTCYYVRPSECSTWAQLQEQIQPLRAKDRLECFFELVIAGSLVADARTFEPVRIFFSTLRSIKIDNTWMGTIRVEVILENCPELEHLEVDSNFHLEKEKLRTDDAHHQHGLATLILPERPLSIKLRRLSLRQVSVALRLLERLFMSNHGAPRASGVIELTLKNVVVQLSGPNGAITNATSAEQEQILNSIYRSCPQLNMFHFSLYGCQQSQEHQAQLFKRFPRIQGWSLHHSDILPSTFLSLWAYTDNVTSLDLACSCGGLSPMTLHEYLCNAPQLRHLWTHSMVYPAEYMDMEPVIENKSGLYSPRACQDPTLNKPAGPTKDLWLTRRVWACRRLETLQIKISGLSGDARTARNSRVMFSYLSLVCPRLRHLSIARAMVNVQLEGGLCYLGRLEELEKLVLQASHFWVKHVSDIEWVQKSSATAAAATAAAAAALKARRAKPSAAGKGRIDRSLSRTTTRGSLAVRSVLPFKKSRTRASMDGVGAPSRLSRAVRKLLTIGSWTSSSVHDHGESIGRIRTTTAVEEPYQGALPTRPMDEHYIIQELVNMYRPQSVNKFLDKLERRKIHAENSGHDDSGADEEIGYCWPDLNIFVMDAQKYSGVSSQSLVTTMARLRPEITFRAFA